MLSTIQEIIKVSSFYIKTNNDKLNKKIRDVIQLVKLIRLMILLRENENLLNIAAKLKELAKSKSSDLVKRKGFHFVKANFSGTNFLNLRTKNLLPIYKKPLSKQLIFSQNITFELR